MSNSDVNQGTVTCKARSSIGEKIEPDYLALPDERRFNGYLATFDTEVDMRQVLVKDFTTQQFKDRYTNVEGKGPILVEVRAANVSATAILNVNRSYIRTTQRVASDYDPHVGFGKVWCFLIQQRDSCQHTVGKQSAWRPEPP